MKDKIEIMPVGTVSPYCKGKHNCPGFLIKYKDKRILLDCGNGISRLLTFPKDLNNLNIIISHYHKDHFGDLGIIQYASFVYNKLGLLNEKINIYLPQKEYKDNKSLIILNQETFSKYNEITDNSIYYVEDLEISFKDNQTHSIPSYMIKIQNSKFKIIYTSDVGNSNIDEIIDYSSNCDLLICESSFVRKLNISNQFHLHADEAANIAKMAKAKKLMLFHFWPEISKEEYLKEAKKIFKDTIISEEGKKLVLAK